MTIPPDVNDVTPVPPSVTLIAADRPEIVPPVIFASNLVVDASSSQKITEIYSFGAALTTMPNYYEGAPDLVAKIAIHKEVFCDCDVLHKHVAK
jgi:hypothetical protein